MSWKGHKFVAADLPVRELNAARARLGDDYDAWLEEKLAGLTEKYKIVATDPATGESIIAEELDQKAIALLPSDARSAVGTILALPLETRIAVLKAFKASGTLNYPFKLIG